MKNETTKRWIKSGAVCAAILAVGIVSGCEKKKAQPVSPPSPEAVQKAVSDATEQTTCPVMGGAINKDIFVEYKGKKVYFCCPSCKGDFEKDPEKYIGKLPQFKE